MAYHLHYYITLSKKKLRRHPNLQFFQHDSLHSSIPPSQPTLSSHTTSHPHTHPFHHPSSAPVSTILLIHPSQKPPRILSHPNPTSTTLYSKKTKTKQKHIHPSSHSSISDTPTAPHPMLCAIAVLLGGVVGGVLVVGLSGGWILERRGLERGMRVGGTMKWGKAAVEAKAGWQLDNDAARQILRRSRPACLAGPFAKESKHAPPPFFFSFFFLSFFFFSFLSFFLYINIHSIHPSIHPSFHPNWLLNFSRKPFFLLLAIHLFFFPLSLGLGDWGHGAWDFCIARFEREGGGWD